MATIVLIWRPHENLKKLGYVHDDVAWALIMASLKPLKGILLIDCAEANLKNGFQTAAYQCGYQSDVKTFTSALLDACQEAGVDVRKLSAFRSPEGIEIAPSSKGSI